MDIGRWTPWSPALLIAGFTLLASVLWLWPDHYRLRVLSVLRGKRQNEPKRDGRTFRVRGVPTEWQRHHLRDALRDRFSEVVVTSLAPEITSHSSTATVVFQGKSPSVREVKDSVSVSLPAATSGSPSSPGRPAWEQSLTLDVNLFGMTTIYAPPENDHKVDVIAISGLGGHSLGSFKQRHGEHMWLRDSLPQHMTDEATSRPMARIVTYGYESRLQDSESIQNIEDLATAFHSSMLPLVSPLRMKPIIFIAHSLGGLIVKQALITLSRSKTEDDQRLLQAVYGVAFFGVPHDGMDITSLIPMAGDGPNRALVDSLSRINSLILSMQQRDFHRALGQEGETEIICFYETLQSPTAQKDKNGQWAMNGPPEVLVTKASATHCRPWEDGPEHICAITRTHSEMVKFGPGDPEYDRVCQRLKGLAHRSIKGGPRRRAVLGTKFMVPFLENTSFVGRSDIFEDVKRHVAIERRLGTASPWPRVVLHGLGGVGKTQIAIAYAYWVYANCPEVSVFWVHANNAERFRDSFANIAEECGIPGHDDAKVDVLPLVKRWLERSPIAWLMIIDNADDGQLFTPGGSLLQAIPECNHGSILATTRNKQAGMTLSMGQQIIEVGALSGIEALELLAAGIPPALSTPEHLADIAHHLECLPLALTQASAFINKLTVTTAEYLRLLQSGDSGFAALLDEDFTVAGRDSGSSHAVAKTWIISFEKIRKSDALAADFLSFMSCLDRHAIPRDMLRVFARRRDGDKNVVDDLRLTKAIGLLQAFSFVTRGQDETLDMHRLVQLVTRKWLAARELDAVFAGQALLAVSEVFPPVDYDTLRPCRSYLAHAHAVRETRGTGNKDEILARANILSDISLYLSYQGEYNAAAPLALEATKVWRGALPADHPSTLESMMLLANIYNSQGRWTDAESILLPVCKTWARTLGEEHPNVLTAQAILASTYWRLGRWNDSEAIQRRVVAARQRLLGEENLKTLESMGSLAATCAFKGQWEEAELMRGRVYETATRVFGQQHPVTLEAAVEVAALHLSKGRWEEAQGLLEKTLTALRTVRGDGHPMVIVCMATLGQCYAVRGMLEEAETLYKHALATWQGALGPEHPEALKCATFLVQNYVAQQRWEEAEALGKRVVEAMERVCGLEHPNTLDSIAALVDVYIGESRWADAELLGRQPLETCTRVLGEGHLYTINGTAAMSRVFYETGRWEEAEALGTRVLNARLTVLGADHPHTLNSLRYLASIYSAQERWQEAQGTLSRLLAIQKEALGEEHPDTVKTMAALALASSDGGRHNAAIALNLQVIEAQKRVHGEDDPATLRAMANQTFLLNRCGKWEEALSLGAHVVDAQKRVLGETDPDTLTSMSTLAFSLRDMGRNGDALSLMQQCAHLRMETLGQEHPDTGDSMEALDVWKAEDQPE